MRRPASALVLPLGERGWSALSIRSRCAAEVGARICNASFARATIAMVSRASAARTRPAHCRGQDAPHPHRLRRQPRGLPRAHVDAAEPRRRAAGGRAASAVEGGPPRAARRRLRRAAARGQDPPRTALARRRRRRVLQFYRELREARGVRPTAGELVRMRHSLAGLTHDSENLTLLEVFEAGHPGSPRTRIGRRSPELTTWKSHPRAMATPPSLDLVNPRSPLSSDLGGEAYADHGFTPGR